FDPNHVGGQMLSRDCLIRLGRCRVPLGLIAWRDVVAAVGGGRTNGESRMASDRGVGRPASGVPDGRWMWTGRKAHPPNSIPYWAASSWTLRIAIAGGLVGAGALAGAGIAVAFRNPSNPEGENTRR